MNLCLQNIIKHFSCLEAEIVFSRYMSWNQVYIHTYNICVSNVCLHPTIKNHFSINFEGIMTRKAY